MNEDKKYHLRMLLCLCVVFRYLLAMYTQMNNTPTYSHIRLSRNKLTHMCEYKMIYCVCTLNRRTQVRGDTKFSILEGHHFYILIKSFM